MESVSGPTVHQNGDHGVHSSPGLLSFFNTLKFDIKLTTLHRVRHWHKNRLSRSHIWILLTALVSRYRRVTFSLLPPAFHVTNSVLYEDMHEAVMMAPTVLGDETLPDRNPTHAQYSTPVPLPSDRKNDSPHLSYPCSPPYGKRRILHREGCVRNVQDKPIAGPVLGGSVHTPTSKSQRRNQALACAPARGSTEK